MTEATDLVGLIENLNIEDSNKPTQAIPKLYELLEKMKMSGMTGKFNATVMHDPECGYWSGADCTCDDPRIDLEEVKAVNTPAALAELGTALYQLVARASATNEVLAVIAEILANRERTVTFQRDRQGRITSATMTD